MSLFSRKRPHLRAVDLAQVPASGPPVPVYRTPGEMIGAIVDEIRNLDNRVVQLETDHEKATSEFERNRAALKQERTELAAQLIEHVRGLGIGPEVVERIHIRRAEA